jgi:hypothetical protein
MGLQQFPSIEIEQVAEADRIEADAAEIQAMSEGSKAGNEITFMGDQFPLADRIGLMPLMKFAHMAAGGMDTDDDFMIAMDTIYTMIRDCIHPDHWARFQDHATITKAGEEELLAVVHQSIEILTARPTQPGTDSSVSSPANTQPSTASRSDRASALGLVPVSDLAG